MLATLYFAKCRHWVIGCRTDYVGSTSGVPETTAEKLQDQSRQRRAKSVTQCCSLSVDARVPYARGKAHTAHDAGSSRLLVRFRFYLFLPGVDAGRAACAAVRRYGAFSPVSARPPVQGAGMAYFSVQSLSRKGPCGGTSSGFALILICRFGSPNPFHKTACWLRALRWLD
jgi:hypothetical protein